MKAVLMLEDGLSFSGEAIGTLKEAVGEVILNTRVVGYQEMMTTPANVDKILVLTYPLIGNYGVAAKFNESTKCWLSGLVIKEKSRIYSNWQATSSLDDFAKKHNLCVLSGVDTRTLALHLRNKGEMPGIIANANADPKELLAKIADLRKNRESLLKKVSVSKLHLCKVSKAKYKIAILDLGLTHSVIRQLETLGCSLVIFPYNTLPQEILRSRPQGLIISDGPENDVALKEVADNVAGLIGKIPLLGISTGHQVLASALGAKVVRMKLGHRGVNYPMYRVGSYKAEITVQNHAYVVDANSLAKIKHIKITGYNLNDRTIEEIESRKMKLIGVQYCLTSPGFGEANNIFKKFIKIVKER